MQPVLYVVLLLLGLYSTRPSIYLKPQKVQAYIKRLFRRLEGVFRKCSLAGNDAEVNGSADIQDGPVFIDKHQLEQTYGPDTWQRKAYENLIDIILSRECGMKTFPCVYATKGYKTNDHRYLFLHSDDPSEPRNVRLIGNALRQYHSTSRLYGPNTTLVALAPPASPLSVDQYNLDFWALLRGLRVFNSKAWPRDVPTETSSSKWSFCFDGEPWFLAVLTPSHARRQSRYAQNLVIAVQPKWVLDNLFSTPTKRKGACQKVRALVADFDEIPLSPDLADHGTPGATESRQYYLLDKNEPSNCPYTDLE